MSQSVTNPALDAAEDLVASLENNLAELRAELWAAEQDADSYDRQTKAEGYAALPAIQERIDALTPLLDQASAIFLALDDLTVSAR
jgi:molecular chaperone GrpE (heat shock protein)